VKDRITELDGLRGLAILLVIGCHYEVFSRQLWTLPRFGWIGVDIFFVLSGFLITSVLLKLKGQERAFTVFYSRRARRILPPYCLFLILLYSASLMLGDYTIFNARSIIGKVFFLQSFGSPPVFHGHYVQSQMLLLPRGIFGAIWHSQSVLWSLSIEEYFYLLWAPAVLWLDRKRLVVLAITICISEIAIRWFGFIGYATYLSIYHRFDALLYGALVALVLASAIPKNRLQLWLSLSLLGAMCVLILVLFSMSPFIGREIRGNRVFETAGLSSFCVAIGAGLGLIIVNAGRDWLAPFRFCLLRFIGTISYMLYLLHVFVYLILLRFFPANWPTTLAASTLSILLCWFSWKYIEQPILASRVIEAS
jgi:peptidoglycan/LPS O-acetylase OafA/YrhL